MARLLKSLRLFSREAPAAPRPDSFPRPRKPQLWVSVWLPNLALEALGKFAVHEPVAVIEPGREHLQVVAVNQSAHALGIEPGLKLSAALVLAESLKVLDRSLRAERACLESLAAWAQQITPIVCIESPESLLLEVHASLKLCGGLTAIKTSLGDEIQRRHWSFQLCAAPTALASLWLVRNHGGDVLSPEQLAGRIGSLPLRVTRWPGTTQALLQDMGIRTIGECCRLPRDGFSRRVGQGYLDDLDKALGKRFDLRLELKTPECWSSRIELLEETSDIHLLLAAIDTMLDALAAKLRKHQRQVQTLSIGFEHAHCDSTTEHFDLLEPSHLKERLLNLIGDRLERTTLPVPAIAVSLTTGPFQAMCVQDPGLFTNGSTATSSSTLIERLRGRFGVSGVYGVDLVAEHRPEYAWSKVVDEITAPFAQTAVVASRSQERPLWILPEPLPLAHARSHYEGALQLQSEPERIESGWWDGADVSRDYYTAIGAHGQKLWIYQDRVSSEWYLHGLFG